MGPKDDPRRWLVIGLDPAGRPLELVVLVYDGYELVIHAMKARPQHLDDLQRSPRSRTPPTQATETS